jgi:release factor glutamine methyltransferase
MRSGYIVKDILAQLTQILSTNIPRASREAQLLLMHYLKKDELWLISNQKTYIDDIIGVREWAIRRSKDEPLEYITNSVSFYSQEFFIKEGALIPRPETELLIDEVLKTYKNRDDNITFVEVGVGSGIISIVLAQHFKNAKFIAIDISKKAIEIAKINIEKFGLSNKIELRIGNLLDNVDEDIDYLVSNPPYIEDGIELDKNLSYEPQNALFGGKIGDEIIKKLLDKALKQKIKFFTCEIGYDQQDKIRNYLKDKEFKSIRFYKDYSDFDRGFTLEV